MPLAGCRGRVRRAGRRRPGARLVRRRSAAALEVRRTVTRWRCRRTRRCRQPACGRVRPTPATGRSSSAASRPRSRCDWAATSTRHLPRRSMWRPPRRWSTRCACRSNSSTRAGSRAASRRRWPSWPTCSRTARWCSPTGCRFEPRDWAAQRCLVTIGAQPVTEHRGSHALADPAFVLPAWLRHATRHGRTVPAGTVVTTGTWCGLPIAAAGDRVAVDFPGIGQAAVQL